MENFISSAVFVTLGFISFFTNIPFDRTIKISLKRIYEYKLITTTSRNLSLFTKKQLLTLTVIYQ